MIEVRVDLAGSGGEIARQYGRLCDDLGGSPIDPARFERRAYTDADLAHARRFWIARMRSEHRSVQVFLQVAGQLIEAGAPLDAQAVMVRLAQDEVRHTEICGQVVVALGAEAAIEVDATIRPLASHAGCSPVERALRNVIYTTCLSEMIACARLVDALEHTTDELLRAATRAILADEVLHGSFGFHYLATLAPVLAGDPALRDSLAAYLQHAFAVLERELVTPLAGIPVPPPGAIGLGVIDPRRAHDVFFNAIDHAIVPALEGHGIAAGDAWRNRRLAT
jgi:hypothetical protein